MKNTFVQLSVCVWRGHLSKFVTKKSGAPITLIRLLDKSKRSSAVNGANEFHGTSDNALFGNPAFWRKTIFVKKHNYSFEFENEIYSLQSIERRDHANIPSVCNGVFMPRKAKRCTRLISPDEITSPCSDTFSKILVSLRKVTFLKVQSSSDTEYLDALSPRANCSSPWMSPLHRNVCGISHPHSKKRLFSLMFGHFQSVKSGSSSSFRFREFALLYNLLPAPLVWFVFLLLAVELNKYDDGGLSILWFSAAKFAFTAVADGSLSSLFTNDVFMFDACRVWALRIAANTNNLQKDEWRKTNK